LPLKNRPEQIIRPLATIERYLGLKEKVVKTYVETLKTKLVRDIWRNQALYVLKLLYKNNGKCQIKTLTKEFNDTRGDCKSEQYVAGILRRIYLSEYIKRSTGGLTQIDVPVSKVLEILDGYNITKELLESLLDKSSESSEPSEAVVKTSEASEPPQERDMNSFFDDVNKAFDKLKA
jgi:hypothetical protein